MAHLSLRLLGPFEASLDGQPITTFKLAKVQALLAYLAVEADRVQPRDTVAGLLWPDYAQSSALTSLRTALATLRQAVGDREADPPFLLITRTTVQFNRDSDHSLDLHDLQRLSAGRLDETP